MHCGSLTVTYGAPRMFVFDPTGANRENLYLTNSYEDSTSLHRMKDSSVEGGDANRLHYRQCFESNFARRTLNESHAWIAGAKQHGKTSSLSCAVHSVDDVPVKPARARRPTATPRTRRTSLPHAMEREPRDRVGTWLQAIRRWARGATRARKDDPNRVVRPPGFRSAKVCEGERGLRTGGLCASTGNRTVA